jgi:phosphomannomutase
MSTDKKVLCLFDVDGTLTEPRLMMLPEMRNFLEELKGVATVGVVGGSDFDKQKEQLGDDVLDFVDYSFSENGLIAYHKGQPLGSTSIQQHLGEDNLKRIINWTLAYIAALDIPIKRGTFIEFRTGMLNISPIGRNCSREERLEFNAYDEEHGVRTAMVEAMRAEFAEMDLTFSIGGQISFDLFPTGWDKTYCLRYIEEDAFEEIHFFGDKTHQGGNDFEIFEHPRTIGHTVTCPEDTERICRELFFGEEKEQDD